MTKCRVVEDTKDSAMEGLSEFDRLMMKRLELSALAFYELKQEQTECQELQCMTDEAGRTRTVSVHHRRPSDLPPSSSSPSTSVSQISTRQRFSDGVRRVGVAGQSSDTDDDFVVTGLAASIHSPRPTAEQAGNATSSISFSISRILGEASTSEQACSRRPGSLDRPSTGRRARSRSDAASPDSSSRVAGDDVDHDVKRLSDVNNDDDDVNDDDVVVELQRQSPPTAAGSVVCGGSLHRLSWLQCTRYKPPKLPRSKKLKDGIKKRKLGRNPRVPFTQHQVSLLEQKFRRTHYLSSVDVAELSTALNLTENRVKIWFQNRRARERRGKDAAVMSAAQPLTVAAGGGGDASSAAVGVEDRRRHHQLTGTISGLLRTDANTADGCCSTISPFAVDDCGGGGRAVLTPENVLQRFSPSDVFAESRRYVVPSTTSTAVAAMMRATLDRCRPSWAVGFPRHHLATPVTSLPLPSVAAAADLLAQLSSNFNVVRQPISSTFSAPPVNLLRF